MINRVVVAGRIVSDPTIGQDGNKASLVLEVQHPRWGGGLDTCRVEVVVFGPRRVGVVQEYLRAGRHLLVEGHLEQEGQQSRVVLERFSFMMDELTTRYLSQEPDPGQARAA